MFIEYFCVNLDWFTDPGLGRSSVFRGGILNFFRGRHVKKDETE